MEVKRINSFGLSILLTALLWVAPAWADGPPCEAVYDYFKTFDTCPAPTECIPFDVFMSTVTPLEGDPERCVFHAIASDLRISPDTDERIVWGGVPPAGGFFETGDVTYSSTNDTLHLEAQISPSSIESFWSNFSAYQLAYFLVSRPDQQYTRIVFQNFNIDGTERTSVDLCADVICSGERSRCVPATGECDCPEEMEWCGGAERCMEPEALVTFPELCSGEGVPLGVGPPPSGGPGDDTDGTRGGGCFQLNARAPSATSLGCLTLLFLAFGFYRFRRQDRV